MNTKLAWIKDRVFCAWNLIGGWTEETVTGLFLPGFPDPVKPV